ncbi:hypothetical protein AMECASPLE_028702 [Ameca splendens]|uniref:Uncharacterized protein n=1 Tax=Ameca splendens TaxID=208324 RepID=A0ABV1A445_9TELE
MPHRGSIDTVRRGWMLQGLQENRLKVSSEFSKYSTTQAVDPWSSTTVRRTAMRVSDILVHTPSQLEAAMHHIGRVAMKRSGDYYQQTLFLQLTQPPIQPITIHSPAAPRHQVGRRNKSFCLHYSKDAAVKTAALQRWR